MSTRTATRFALLGLVILAVCGMARTIAVSRQIQTKTFTMKSDESTFVLKEVGGIIADSNGTLTVRTILEPQNRMEEYKKVDLQEGDIVKMANARKLESAGKLTEIYDGLKVGEDLKLGIVRSGSMKIVSLPKGDPDKLPKQMVTMTIGGGDQAAGGPVQMLAVAGLLITAVGNQLTVADLIEGNTPEFEGAVPTDGDQIVKLNGEIVDSGAKLDKAFNAVSEGSEIELTLLRNGKELTTSFTKPPHQNLKMMQKPAGSKETDQ